MVNRDVIKIFAYDYPKDYQNQKVLWRFWRQGKKVEEIPVVMGERNGGGFFYFVEKNLFII